MGVRINPTAEFQPATHVCSFKILNALDMVRMQCCVCRLRRALRRAGILHVQCVDFLRVFNNAFIFLRISLYSTCSTSVYTRKKSFFCFVGIDEQE